ncbi:MAG: riboflavin biosynthesis protein RibD [Candidatus Epulonipiscioides saccharophilum]|nr:MAG: riboflavin biosynthesis protein RibD [Epulopiscium sp. AS2M-Bin001]
MSKVIIYIAMSLDGYIADINGGVNWLKGDGSEPDNAGSYFKFIDTIDSIILGSKTYNQIITELSPNNWPYKGKQTYVLTSNKKKYDEINSMEKVEFIDQNIKDFIIKIKADTSQNIWICGGANIINQVYDLVDEYIISIIPTLLGSGIRLFKNNKKIDLKLVSTTVYNGIVDLKYVKK